MKTKNVKKKTLSYDEACDTQLRHLRAAGCRNVSIKAQKGYLKRFIAWVRTNGISLDHRTI